MALLEFNEKLHEKSLKEEGFEEGFEKGKLTNLLELVSEGVITKEIAIKKSGLSEEEFIKLMY